MNRNARGPAALLAVAVLAGAWGIATFGCAPPPPPAVLTLGTREIRFASGQVQFTGKGDTAVNLLFRAQEDPSRSDGLVLDLQILEKPGTLPHDFAGRTYAANKAASGPAGQALLLLHQPVPPAGTRPGYTLRTTPVADLTLTVSACATGILEARGTGKAVVDGVEVPVSLTIEKR